jgi:hypothetical protein
MLENKKTFVEWCKYFDTYNKDPFVEQQKDFHPNMHKIINYEKIANNFRLTIWRSSKVRKPITEYEHLIPNLTHLLGYRVKVAELLLSDLDLDTRNSLKESYNQVNKKIKDLLAL